MIMIKRYSSDRPEAHMALVGCPGRILDEYRMLTAYLHNIFGTDAMLMTTAGCLNDDLSKLSVDIQGFKIVELRDYHNGAIIEVEEAST